MKFIIDEFPHVRHIVWNNLDPLAAGGKILDTIPRLNDFELELFKSMQMLEKNGKTFRVERVPLCYMADYAQFSTETRKIVKQEERIVHFLDDRKKKKQDEWNYGKSDRCAVCSFSGICAGLWQMDEHYFSDELYPVFLDPEIVKEKILNS